MQKKFSSINTLSAIKTDKDYRAALGRLETLFDSKPHTPQGNEAELLVILIEDYERKHYPIDAPSPIEAIKFRMDQLNLKQSDLAKYLGTESRVSEVLSGKRSLTISMISALHENLDIPLESLISVDNTKKSRAQNISVVREPKAAYRPRKRKTK